MKRTGNLYAKICSVENLQLADSIARKGKLKQPGVVAHDKNSEANIQSLHDMLVNKTYITSEYTTFTIREPKERLIFRLPYFPDRITHHAVMNIQKRVNAASKGTEFLLIDQEEEARIRELIALKTFPNKWTGEEITGDITLDKVYSDGSVMPILFRDWVGKSGLTKAV